MGNGGSCPAAKIALSGAWESPRLARMGRFSTLLLRPVSHVFTVRVCAPLEVRVRRVMERHATPRAPALKMIQAYEAGVRARAREFFGVDWRDPLQYDLTVNTERVSLETGAEQVLRLLERPEFRPTDASRRVLADLHLRRPPAWTWTCARRSAGWCWPGRSHPPAIGRRRSGWPGEPRASRTSAITSWPPSSRSASPVSHEFWTPIWGASRGARCHVLNRGGLGVRSPVDSL